MQYTTEDDTGKDVADAQQERYVADDLSGTSVSLAFIIINALDGEEANISSQDDGSLFQVQMGGQQVSLSGDGEDTHWGHRIRPILSKVCGECTPPASNDFVVH